MKLRYVLACVCLPLIGFAQMSITTLESVLRSVNPDTLRTTLHFTEENKNENAIKEHLNAIIAQIKQMDTQNEMCRGGGYHLSPRYSYKEQKKTFIGYSGTLMFTCNFPTIEAYNALLAKTESIKAPTVLLNYGALSWDVSPNVRKETRLAMRSSLLKTAHDQAGYFSKETQKKCTVSSITFEDAHANRPVALRTMARSADALKGSEPIEEPLRGEEEIMLNATVTYTCVEP